MPPVKYTICCREEKLSYPRHEGIKNTRLMRVKNDSKGRGIAWDANGLRIGIPLLLGADSKERTLYRTVSKKIVFYEFRDTLFCRRE